MISMRSNQLKKEIGGLPRSHFMVTSPRPGANLHQKTTPAENQSGHPGGLRQTNHRQYRGQHSHRPLHESRIPMMYSARIKCGGTHGPGFVGFREWCQRLLDLFPGFCFRGCLCRIRRGGRNSKNLHNITESPAENSPQTFRLSTYLLGAVARSSEHVPARICDKRNPHVSFSLPPWPILADVS